MISSTLSLATAPQPAAKDHRGWAELLALTAVIAAVNWAMLEGGRPAARFAFLSGAITTGEWWRVATHPFAHVSLYHLLLDASAFLFLYHSLLDLSLARRLTLCAGAIAGSLGLATLAPAFGDVGLCGLSGPAHGLMATVAVSALRVSSGVERRVVGTLLAIVLGKSLLEALTGNVVLIGWHLGNVGQPNAYCHLGGVLGALTVLGVQWLLGETPRP